jgi:ABC-type uncharacterized transport system permease subunit
MAQPTEVGVNSSVKRVQNRREAATVIAPVAAYLVIGMATVAGSLWIGRELDLSYFQPVLRMVQGVFGSATDHQAAMLMIVRFTVLFLLALAFISAFRGGYILLGFEGAAILALVVVVIVTHALSLGAPVNIAYWLAGATAAGLAILILCSILIAGFYKLDLDDVTPGIVLNVLAVPIAALLLSVFGLQAPADQGVASVAAGGAAVNASAESQHLLSIILLATCVAAAALTAFVFSRFRAGLLVRAVGSNRQAAGIAGVNLVRTAITVSMIVTLCVVAVASAHYFSTGRIQVEMMRNQLIDVLTAALVARLSLSGLPFGVLTLLGLAEFKLYLQYHEYAPETALAVQGLVLLFFAFQTPLRGTDAND